MQLAPSKTPGHEDRAARLEHGLLFVVQIASLALVARSTVGIDGFPLDDAWIHQVVARTFAETGTLGYEADRFGSGATSYLWAALLALNFKLVHASPALYALLLGAACHVAAGQLFLACLRRDGLGVAPRLWIAALFAAAANGVWFAVSGMEASLTIALSMLAIHAWDGGGARAKPIAAGLAAGAVAWARPEAALLAPLLVALSPAPARRSRTTGKLLSAWALLVGLELAMNLALSGSVLPATLRGRTWMWLQPLEGASRLAMAGELLAAWQERLAAFTLKSDLAFWLALGAAALGVKQLVDDSLPRMRAVAAWAALHLLVFAVLLPVTGHGGRYQPLTPAVFMALAALGLMGTSGASASTRRRAFLAAALPLPFAVQTARSLLEWGELHHRAVTHVQATEVAMGRMVADLPQDAMVASFDIGGIGYHARRPILDLGALVDPALADMLRRGEIGALLAERGITHVVLPMSFGDELPEPWNFLTRLGLDDHPRVALRATAERASALSLWLPGFRATMHSAPRQVLYAVTPRPKP